MKEKEVPYLRVINPFEGRLAEEKYLQFGRMRVAVSIPIAPILATY